MSVFDFLETFSDEESLKFKRCIRKLLDTTFIVENKDKSLYEYLSYSSNRENISNYLKVMGYDLVVDDDFKYAMLVQNEQDIDTVGLKKISHIKFSNNETLTLLILWMLFLERFGKEDQTYVDFEDIIDMQKQYGILMSPNEIRQALKLFKRFSLVNFNEADIAVITLYPSLQFAFNKDQLISVMNDQIDKLKEMSNEDVLTQEDDE